MKYSAYLYLLVMSDKYYLLLYIDYYKCAMALKIIILIVFVYEISTYIYFSRYIRKLSSALSPKPLDRISFFINVLINIPLFGIGVYSLIIAKDSLDIASKAYNDSKVSGPKQEAALDGSRIALERTVELLRKQQASTDSSRIALELVVKSAFKQQATLDKQLINSNTQLELLSTEKQDKESVERERLSLAINEIFSALQPKELEVLYQAGRPYKIDWIKNITKLYELELTNSLLLRDKKANSLWSKTLKLLRDEVEMQSDESLDRAVVVDGRRDKRTFEDAEKILSERFKTTVGEISKNTIGVYEKLVRKD